MHQKTPFGFCLCMKQNLNLFQSTSEYQKRQLTNFLTFEWSKATDHVRPLGQFNPRPADVPSMPRVLHLCSFPPSIPLFTAGWAGPWRPIDLLHATVHLLWKKRKFQKITSSIQRPHHAKNKTWAKALKSDSSLEMCPLPQPFHPRQQNKKDSLKNIVQLFGYNLRRSWLQQQQNPPTVTQGKFWLQKKNYQYSKTNKWKKKCHQKKRKMPTNLYVKEKQHFFF